MNVVCKRLIAIMVSAIMFAGACVSFIKAMELNDDSIALNNQLEQLQVQLYNSIKHDPDYQVEYTSRLNELQQNFFSGKIGAQEYDKQLSELNSNTHIISYAQRPDVKEEYKDEIAGIENIENKIHDISINKGVPNLVGFIVGTTGGLAGISVVTSTIKTKDDYDEQINNTL